MRTPKNTNFFSRFLASGLALLAFQSGLSSADEASREKLYALQQRAKATLLTKLRKGEDDWVDIKVVTPVDYTNLISKDFVKNTVEEILQAYDSDISVSRSPYKLKGISLDMLRLAVADTKADVLVSTVFLPSNVDVYIYDKRSPFQIYAHSEAFVEGNQEDLDVKMAEHYTRIAFRRALFRYISDQTYDLPRDGSPPVLQSPIPRVIASYQTVEMINREANSNFYASFNWGAALSNGTSGKFWNSSLVSLELGANVAGKFYVEGAAEISAYNLAVGSVKYLFSDRDEAFRFMFGVGGAVLSTRHTFDWDQSNDIQGRKFYVVPSFSVMFPISDVYLKLESRAFINSQSQIYTFMPGLHIWF
ncbi:MAG: hypothetical protein EBQ92_06475 [Proteobacteria bacterium]|nr:hypothetical protein [Pseudomonadota bacterium]